MMSLLRNRWWTAASLAGLTALCVIGVPGSRATTAPGELTDTTSTLKAVYSRETAAHAKYLADARLCDSQGERQAATLFRAAAAAETIHARNNQKVLESLGIRDLTPSGFDAAPAAAADLLRDAMRGEIYERDTWYPACMKVCARTAAQAGESDALTALKYARYSEMLHAGLFARALAAIGSGSVRGTYYVCTGCGGVFVIKGKGRCPLCHTNTSAWETFSTRTPVD